MSDQSGSHHDHNDDDDADLQPQLTHWRQINTEWSGNLWALKTPSSSCPTTVVVASNWEIVSSVCQDEGLPHGRKTIQESTRWGLEEALDIIYPKNTWLGHHEINSKIDGLVFAIKITDQVASRMIFDVNISHKKKLHFHSTKNENAPWLFSSVKTGKPGIILPVKREERKWISCNRERDLECKWTHADFQIVNPHKKANTKVLLSNQV